MSGVIQECNMMFSELIDDAGMRGALALLKVEIESYLMQAGRPAEGDAQRLADAYADVFWRLQEQR